MWRGRCLRKRSRTMWIVRLALRRPYTFVVVSLLIAVLGLLSIISMPTDIFPSIDIPVISVIWSYGGLSATEMQDRITTVVERAMTTTVSNIEHLESESVRGNSVIKLYFQPGADVNAAIAQVTAICQTLLKPLPTGITPPLILQYNAADVPVLMISLGSDQLSEQEISDLGNNFIRTQLVAVPGAAVPLPFGGKSRVVNIDLDADALYARNLSPTDINTAVLAQNIVVSPGTAKMGPIEYDVAINSSPEILDDLNNIPVKFVNGATVYLRDVAFVHDGFTPQTNLVRRDGRHSALLPVLTSGSVSTLSICIVFVPIFLLSGVGGFLFAPLAMAVVFAMLASYFLSRTLVPTMFLYLMPADERMRKAAASGGTRRSFLGRVSDRFEAGFHRLTNSYQGALDWALEYRAVALTVFLAFALASLLLFPLIGRDFFPTVDAG